MIFHNDTSNNWGEPCFFKAVEVLLNAGADIEARNNDGETALHIMARHRRLGCVVVLLSCGANANVQCKDGSTPLHQAAVVSVVLWVFIRSRTPCLLISLHRDNYYKVPSVLETKNPQACTFPQKQSAARGSKQGYQASFSQGKKAIICIWLFLSFHQTKGELVKFF